MEEDKLYQRLDLGFLKSKGREVERRKISEAVFDRETVLSLYHLVKRGALTELNSIVSTGKEASLFWGKRGKKDVAVKIYLVDTSDFRHMSKYVRGDPRFHSWKNRRQLVYMWASKEFKNLNRVCDFIPCPKPIEVFQNVLVMEFLGKGGNPAPRLKDAAPEDPQGYYKRILGYVRKMYGVRLVHADLSEYNILDWKGKPYLIDFSAGVLLDHPSAVEFLQRDIGNIVNYFGKLNVKVDINAALKYVLDEK